MEATKVLDDDDELDISLGMDLSWSLFDSDSDDAETLSQTSVKDENIEKDVWFKSLGLRSLSNERPIHSQERQIASSSNEDATHKGLACHRQCHKSKNHKLKHEVDISSAMGQQITQSDVITDEGLQKALLKIATFTGPQDQETKEKKQKPGGRFSDSQALKQMRDCDRQLNQRFFKWFNNLSCLLTAVCVAFHAHMESHWTEYLLNPFS